MELHNLLQKQLERSGLDSYMLPSNIQEWEAFLERVNNSYREADQERYLLERSMEISSREMHELNERLESAQHTARLGYWFYDRAEDRIILSKELYHLYGFNPDEPAPRYEQFMQLIHQDERANLEKKIEQAFAKGTDYEYEIRIKHPQKDYRWYLIIGHPDVTKEKPYTFLYGIAMDITKRKQSEEKIAALNQQLLASVTKQAGMADVATAMLHNVGNVLNSANVSVSLLRENIKSPYYKKLFTVISMLKEHAGNLNDYLTQDEKGKIIPEYLITVSKVLEQDMNMLASEIDNLNIYIQHIKDIVSMQQTISSVSGVREKVSLPEMMDTALKIAGSAFEEKSISVVKNYRETGFIKTDKSKLLQILVNLIRNAKDAILASTSDQQKKITLFIEKGHSGKEILLGVQDSGIGIAPENATKIFAFGFTTKPKGHGFGLHNSALAAKELGGKLQVESKGIGQGATFTVYLPLNKEKQNERKE